MRCHTGLIALACGLMLALTTATEAQVQFSVGNPYSGQGLTFGNNGAGNFYVTPGYGNTAYAYPYSYNANSGYTYPYYSNNYYGNPYYANPYYGNSYPSYGANTTQYYSSGYSGYTNPAATGYGYSNYYGNPYRSGYGAVSPYSGYSSYGSMRTYVPYGTTFGGRR